MGREWPWGLAVCGRGGWYEAWVFIMLLLVPWEGVDQFWRVSGILVGAVAVDFVFSTDPCSDSVVVFEIIFSFGEWGSNGGPIGGVLSLGGAGVK